MGTARFTQWLPVAIEQVFLFFANPENLPRIMPPETETRLIELRLVAPAESPNANAAPLAGIESEIVTSFRVLPLLPFRAGWTALITEFEWNHHFSDVQKIGPFRRFQHRHEFEAQVRDGKAGTLVRDVIEYEVGFGPLGFCIDRLFVARRLQRTFAYRQDALRKLLG